LSNFKELKKKLALNQPYQIKKQLAKYYMQLGLINSSLDIYLNLQMWEDVINCYQALDKRDKVKK